MTRPFDIRKNILREEKQDQGKADDLERVENVIPLDKKIGPVFEHLVDVVDGKRGPCQSEGFRLENQH